MLLQGIRAVTGDRNVTSSRSGTVEQNRIRRTADPAADDELKRHVTDRSRTLTGYRNAHCRLLGWLVVTFGSSRGRCG
jgi:hypothetical protein